ncbi:MAG: hypothetical protein ABSE57_19405 [Bryobacteraceae bacterium]|jgi:2-hydroxychromene-2-carboxylate isomerase
MVTLAERGVEAEAAARATLTAAYEEFMAEGDPAKKSEVGEDLIQAIFGEAAIAGAAGRDNFSRLRANAAAITNRAVFEIPEIMESLLHG